MSVCGDEGADVGDGAHVLEEAGVGAGHVCAHVVDEVCRGSLLDGCDWCVGGFAAGGTVLDSEDQVEELDDGGLGVAAAAVLPVSVVFAAGVEDDAVW